MKLQKIILIIVLLNLIIIPIIAQGIVPDFKWCCLENINEQYCREYSPEDISQYCDMSSSDNYHEGSCEEASNSCQTGCCYNSQKQCITGSIQLDCESSEGNEWFNDAGCNLQQCQQGCCILGSQSVFTTTEGCDLWSMSYGLPKEFHLGASPEDCYDLVSLQAEGACLIDAQGGCIFTTKEQCFAQTNDFNHFYEGYLCSHSELNTSCQAKDYTGCVTGKYEVYWFDSCGNKENIYGTPNDNDGSVKSKSQSCVSNIGSNQANCGNCEIGISICGLPIQGKDVDPNQGDYVCRDMRCVDEQGNIRENGESWCIYEGKVGEGKDVVGSSHWKYYCQNGEVKTENCDEKRDKICVEQTDDNDFSSAGCINNEWERCIDHNLVEPGENWLEDYVLLRERIDSCDEDKFCYVKRMYIGGPEIPGTEAYSVCVPKWPGGFDLTSEQQKETAMETCDIGSRQIVCKGKVAECISELNDLCVNMGDCGAYVNYNGEYTTGGVAKYYGNANARVVERLDKKYALPSSKLDEYISNSNPDFSQKISVEELVPGGEIYEDLGGTGARNANPRYGSRKKTKIIEGTLYINPRYKGKFRNNRLFPGFQCLPWQAPVDGNCNLCTNDPLKPCTSYRCQSLGKNCKLVNEGTDYELCYNQSQEYDITPPMITDLINVQNTGLNAKIYPSVNGYQLWNSARGDGCIEAHSEISFGIKTDEPAVCRFARAPVPYSQNLDFNSIPELFGEHNYLDYNHTLNTSLPSIEEMANYYEVDLAYTRQNFGLYNYYIRCEDSSGNSNINEYLIKMCVNPEPDIQAPFIRAFMPPETNYFKYGVSEYPFHLWTNEQAGCRMTDNIIDQQNYDAMTPMDCRNNFNESELLGWRCSENLVGLTNNKKYYILCKDKPWLPEDNETRRLMAQAREYTVKITENPLIISSITINSKTGENIELFSNTAYSSVTLDVVTSGGADQGEPICYWKKSETASYNEFRETKLSATPNNHRQTWSALNNGTHTIYIYCADKIANEVSETITFKLSKDTDYPIIVRMYYDNQLKIITNENAMCKYSNNFTENWGNKSLMGSSDHRLHTSPWYKDKVYYIQCEDDYFNRIPLENQIEIVSYDKTPNL